MLPPASQRIKSLKAGARGRPPLCDGMDSKFGRIIGVAQIDIAVMGDVIDAIRQPSASAGKSCRLTCAGVWAPSAAFVGEVADQFLVLGIDTDDRIAAELLSHTTNVVKLAGLLCARQALAVGDQAKAQLAQQPTDVVRPILYACARSRDAIVRKLTRTHFCPSETSNVVIDDFLDLLFYRWTFFSSAGRPPPGLRTRGRPAKSSFNSRRPRRIVLTFIPVICAIRSVPPKRYVPASMMPSKTFMRWWSSLSANRSTTDGSGSAFVQPFYPNAILNGQSKRRNLCRNRCAASVRSR